MNRGKRLRVGITWAIALLLGGCGTGPGARPAAPQLGLARGARWSVLAVQPPHLTGPFFELELRDHLLTGWIAGESAPGGALRVRIDDDQASGFAPSGPVALDIIDQPDALVVEGTWNGQRCKVAFSAEGMRGTVADNARPAVPSPLERVAGQPRRYHSLLESPPAFEPGARNSSCQYVLDHRDEGGGVSGTSICDGMPQQTRLEVPAVVDALMTRSELVTVMVAFLSAPPIASTEPFPRGGETARFDGDF